MPMRRDDTIAALATAPGVGAVAIVRLSGASTHSIVRALTGRDAAPRVAELRTFRDVNGVVIDRGLVLFFPAPRSFTGEDVAELHCHGGRIVSDTLLAEVYRLGARPAEAGEFSLRAFLHDKIDLLQAEAIADLVTSSSARAARAATRSLEGEFSGAVTELQHALTALRVRTEAWLDFPDEELPLEAAAECEPELDALVAKLDELTARARSGRALRDGLTLAIAGAPNAGKSSLLNRLAGYDAAIVTEIPGTTRDPLREHVTLDGLPVTVVDTAGLREASDPVEREGVRRARLEVARADRLLWVADVREPLPEALAAARATQTAEDAITIVANKVDLATIEPRVAQMLGTTVVYLSALTGAGLELLVAHLKDVAGVAGETVGTLGARRRHLDALARTRAQLQAARPHLGGALELAAEHLRAAQTSLSELTGELTSDDLLGEIFATFCIGK